MHLDLPVDHLVLVGAALLVLGVVGAGLAQRLRFPGLILFLLLGMALGDDGLDWISLSDARFAQGIAVAALVVILYEGGLGTSVQDIRPVVVPAVSLATLGVIVTAAICAGAAELFLDVDGTTALILGAVVASTDAAAVFSVLRGVGLPRRLKHLLEAESGANDPMAVLLTVGLLAGWEGHVDAGDWVVFGARQLAGGLAMGCLVGGVGAALLTHSRLASTSLYPVLGLGLGGLAYGGAASLHLSGFLAVYVTGMVVAARAPASRRAIRVFHQGLASTAQIGLFLLLGLLVFPSRLDTHAAGAFGVAVVLVLVARPLAVLVSVGWMRFRWPELVLLSWSGLRGAVPIVLATFPLTSGYPEGQLVFDVVFFVVVVSVLVQGLTVGPLARRMGLRAEPDLLASVAEVLPIDAPGVEVLEIEVGSSCGIVGRPLAEAPPPGDARVAVVVRDEEVIVPTGSTSLRPGDRVVVFGAADPALADAIGTWIAAGTRTDRGGADLEQRQPGDP
jgi:cell volume regulation protein A